MGDMNFSLTTFNKSGKLLQIEYALKRVSQGKMALGIKAKNGVVIACDKKVHSVLVDTDEYQKIASVTPSCGFVYAGMGPDFRVLLFQVDPSGAYFGWKATAIGKNYENAKNFLERRYNDDIELDDAIHTALLTLRESYDGEMTESNIEVGVISDKDKTFRVLTPAEVKDFLDEAN
eukprot:GSChrysophyteH1.ASY1.ANO1.769.1 assembled CDS